MTSPRPLELRKLIEADSYRAEMDAALGADKAAFDEAVIDCMAGGSGPQDAEKVKCIRELVAKYPKVEALLKEKAPQFFEDPDPPVERKAGEVKPPGSNDDQTTDKSRGGGGAPTSVTTSWTPETVTQFFKEIVTAMIAVVLVFVAGYIAISSLQNVGDRDRMTAAKDILTVIVGLLGVVLGYYFGRLPGDAHAAQAQKRADAATAQTQEIGAKAAELATQTQEVVTRGLTRAGGGASTPPTLDPVAVANADRVRKELLDLALRGRNQW